MKKCSCGKKLDECIKTFPAEDYIREVAPVYLISKTRKQRVGTLVITEPYKGGNLRLFLEWCYPIYRRHSFVEGWDVDDFLVRHHLEVGEGRQIAIGFSDCKGKCYKPKGRKENSLC
jgi:hypothetical protein